MTPKETIAMMRLLAALESWAFAQGKILPDYLHEDLCRMVNVLERELLKDKQ